MRSRGNGDPRLQVLIDAIVAFVLRGRFDGERCQAFAVQQQLDLVRLAQPLDLLVAVARQPGLDVVLAVLPERVRYPHAAARAKRQSLDVAFLSPIGPGAKRVAARRLRRAADRQSADLLRRRDVALQQRGRQVPQRGAVEAVIRLIRGQQGRGVDVEREQIADRVLVLGAVQPSQGRRPPRMRPRRRRSIQRRHECGNGGLILRLARPWPADGRHLPRGELAYHLFPDHRVGVDRVGADRVERQAASFGVAVVARGAMLLDELPNGWSRGRRLRRGLGRWLRQPDQSGRQHHGGHTQADTKLRAPMSNRSCPIVRAALIREDGG